MPTAELESGELETFTVLSTNTYGKRDVDLEQLRVGQPANEAQAFDGGTPRTQSTERVSAVPTASIPFALGASVRRAR